MTVPNAVRRGGASLAGVIGALALVACSSSSNGKPVPAGSLATGSSAPISAASSVPRAPSTAGVTAPPSDIPSSQVGPPSSGPAISAGISQFCKDVIGQGSPTDVGSSGDINEVIAIWDKLAAEAPPEIKGDVKAVDDYLRGALSGKIQPDAAQKLGNAETGIATYVATKCR